MSDRSPGPGWWQASDGKWYPPESAPGYQSPAPGVSPASPDPQPGPYGQAAPPFQPGPYSQPGPYGQPSPSAYGGFPGAPKTDGLAVASLVSSIVGALLVIFCVGLAGTIAGFTMGLIARNRIKSSNGQLTGEGMALAGIIIGAAATVLYVALIIAFVALGGPLGSPP